MEYNIRANTYKDFLGSALTIIIVVAIAVGLWIFLDNQIDFSSTFGEVFSNGDEAAQNPSNTGNTITLVLLAGVVVILLLNYLSIMNIKYTLGDGYLRIKQPQAAILSETKEIKFESITRVYVERTLNNKILGGGNIVLELTGTKDKSVSLKCIENLDQVMAFIMQKMEEHKMQKQMQYQETQKITGIMQKF